MLEGIDPTNSGASAWSIRGTYKAINRWSQQPSDTDKPAIAAHELLNCNVAEARRTASEANDAVSLMQTLAAAANAILQKVTQMKELAESGTTSALTDEQKADDQEELLSLAGQVNNTAQNTAYDDNKLFTASGQPMSVPLGDGEFVLLFPRDLSFDVSGVDLRTDAERALAKVLLLLAKAAEASQYFGRQLERLEGAMADFDSDLGVLDIDSDSFTPPAAAETASYTASLILQDSANASSQIYKDFIPETAAWLLRNF